MNEQEIHENADELIDKALDIIDNNAVAVKNNPWLIAGAGVIGFVAGAAISYWATKKYALELFEETLQEEVQHAQQYFDKLYREGDFASPADAVEALIPEEERSSLETAESLREAYEGRPEDRAMKVDYTQPHKKKHKKIKTTTTEISEETEGEAVDEVRAISRSIWVNDRPIEDGGWDYDSVERSEDHPYIISEEEFFESAAASGNYEGTQMTWYNLDETLADASDDVVPTDVIGEENLKMFGKFPGVDPNTIYVKNEILKRVYEIAYSDGGFGHEVQGYDYTPEQAEKMARKIRGDDD